MNFSVLVTTSLVVHHINGFDSFPSIVTSFKTSPRNPATRPLLRSYAPGSRYKPRPSTLTSSKLLFVQNKAPSNDKKDPILVSFAKIHRRGVPRSSFRSASSATPKQRLFVFLKRFSTELFCIVIILSWISAISSRTLCSLTLQRNFLVTSLSRWIAASLGIRAVLLHSEITSSFPSMSKKEDDNWFLSGSYFLLSDKTAQPVSLRIRQVPGNGSCLFYAIAASILYNDSSTTEHDHKRHPPMSEVCKLSSQLRKKAVDVLSRGILHTDQLIKQKDETVDVATLVRLTAHQYGITSSEYLETMRDETVWGGGPEIVALANLLQRDIVLLETLDNDVASPNLYRKGSDVIYLKVSARFGPSSEGDESQPSIYILSANQMFPKKCGMRARKNHFLAVFPSCSVLS